MIKYFMRLWHESKLEAERNISNRKNRCPHRISVNNGHDDMYLRCAGPKRHKGLHSAQYVRSIDCLEGELHDNETKTWKDSQSDLVDGRYDD